MIPLDPAFDLLPDKGSARIASRAEAQRRRNDIR
jgi:hypothetical protein